MEQGQDYTEGTAKHPRKTRVVFRGCKDVCGQALSWWKVTPLPGQFWALLLNGFPQNNRVARIWWHWWFGSLGAARNKSLPWYPTDT